MDWTKLEVDGRVTALRDGACAGVTAEGTGFVAMLADPCAGTTVVDEMRLDSFGVVGLSGGDTTWLTGRGPDGQMHLWQVAGPHLLGERSLEGQAAAWAAPAVDAKASALLVADLADGRWGVQAHTLGKDDRVGAPRGRGLRLGGPPDASMVYSFHERGTITVAGAVGDSTEPPTAAWMIDTDPTGRGSATADWRRVHLAPAPTELTSVGVAAAGRRTWIAGRVEAKPVIYEVLSLPFRGLVRSAAVTVPVLTLSPESLVAPARAVVLVEYVEGDHPVFLAATANGNRLCWSTAGGTSWQAVAAPDGRVHAACLAGGRIHALVDGSVWSLPDPTRG
jgi:hypothetical protein